MTYPSDAAAVLDREPPLAAGTTAADLDDGVGGVLRRGHRSRPDDDGTHPGLLVPHEWGCIGDHVPMRSDLLARPGYAAPAADLYGADGPPDAAGVSCRRGPLRRRPAAAAEPAPRPRSDAPRPAGRPPGATDPTVPGAAVSALQDELRGAPGLDGQLSAYAGAMQAITMPGVDVPEHGAQSTPPSHGGAGGR